MLRLVVYKNKKEELVFRLRKTIVGLEVGTFTSMGWEVLSIQCFYEGKFVLLDTFQNLLYESMKKRDQKKSKRKKVIELFYNIFH